MTKNRGANTPKRKFFQDFVAISLTALFVATLFIALAMPSYSQTEVATSKADDKAKPIQVLTEDNEVRIGRENAESNDKQVKLLTDAVIVERVNRIGKEIAAVANKTPIIAKWGSGQLKPFNYSFKVVDDKDVNAYSLPGGFIYVNKGLLDYVRSDDELAGVLAHEITHASHHHMMKLMHEQKKIQNILLPAVLAAAVLAKGNMSNIGAILTTSQLYTTAKLNTYGIEAEKDADYGGLTLLTHTKYSPVGLYSVMLRLAADERNRTFGDLGIFRTHPPGDERAEAAKKLLDELHIPLELSKVDPSQKVLVTLNKAAAKGRDIAELKIQGMTLCKVVAAEDQTAEERGLKIARRITPFFDTQLQSFEVKINTDKTKVTVRGVVVLTSEDALWQDKTLTVLANEMSGTISKFGLKRQLDEVGK